VRCPSCQKKVVFGSISGETWRRVHAGDWLYGTSPPKPGTLGDCPVCGVRLTWEPGEQALNDPDRPPVARVHLFALRESPSRTGREIALRAILVDRGAEAWLSDSWRVRSKDQPETDQALLERLGREQIPRVSVRFAADDVRAQFQESARKLDGGMAAWVEAEGHFRDGTLDLKAITSIWPPRD
jgi:hypothetical protein